MKFLSSLERSKSPSPSDVDVTFDVIVDALEILEIKVNACLVRKIVQVTHFHSFEPRKRPSGMTWRPARVHCHFYL